MCVLGEVRHIWYRGVADNELCACGRAFHDCPFWSAVGDRAFGGWDHVDVATVRKLARRVDRMRYVPTGLMSGELSEYRAVAREYASYFSRVYDAAKQVSGASVIVDSSKNASTAYALRADPSINLSVLHVVRDSRGVAYSWTKEVPRPEVDGSSERPLMDRYPPWTSALLWDAHNLAFAMLARQGVPVHRVFYERFLADPVATTEAIARFLGVDATGVEQSIGQDSIALVETHQAAGNPIRFRRGNLAFRSDDEWREELPPAARRLVGALTWPLMAAYGYRHTLRARL